MHPPPPAGGPGMPPPPTPPLRAVRPGGGRGEGFDLKDRRPFGTKPPGGGASPPMGASLYLNCSRQPTPGRGWAAPVGQPVSNYIDTGKLYEARAPHTLLRGPAPEMDNKIISLINFMAG
jgi:hypothetical protein